MTLEHPSRAARAKAIGEAEGDHAAAEAALGMLRMRQDPAFRKRYGAYLRNEIDWRTVTQGETHRAWYDRIVRQNQEDNAK